MKTILVYSSDIIKVSVLLMATLNTGREDNIVI